MNEYVVDTVALVLRLEARVMGSQAQQIFVDMEQGKARLHVPTMVFAEILYLAERKRIAATLTTVHAYLNRFANCTEAPLTLAVTMTARQIADIPELHDRLIAATALHLQLPLLTNDMKIRASRSVTRWPILINSTRQRKLPIFSFRLANKVHRCALKAKRIIC